MRRTMAVLGVAATLAVGQTALAWPAGAKTNGTCDPGPNLVIDCRGGQGSAGGGGGGNNYFDGVSGEGTSSGGRGFGGGAGGYGQHCSGNFTEGTVTCVGGGSSAN